jgi:hypothetical protein
MEVDFDDFDSDEPRIIYVNGDGFSVYVDMSIKDELIIYAYDGRTGKIHVDDSWLRKK